MYSLYDAWGFPCEFPHSEIFGSLAMCAYPKLIAAYHVLHRLLMPRHSPCALCSLTYLVNFSKSSQFWFSQRIVFNKYFISWLVVSTIYIHVQFSKNKTLQHYVTLFLRNNGFSKLNRIYIKTFFFVRNPNFEFFNYQLIILLTEFSIERR